MGASHGIGYRPKQRPTGGTVRKSGDIGHCMLQFAKQLDSRVDIG